MLKDAITLAEQLTGAQFEFSSSDLQRAFDAWDAPAQRSGRPKISLADIPERLQQIQENIPAGFYSEASFFCSVFKSFNETLDTLIYLNSATSAASLSDLPVQLIKDVYRNLIQNTALGGIRASIVYEPNVFPLAYGATILMRNLGILSNEDLGEVIQQIATLQDPEFETSSHLYAETCAVMRFRFACNLLTQIQHGDSAGSLPRTALEALEKITIEGAPIDIRDSGLIDTEHALSSYVEQPLKRVAQVYASLNAAQIAPSEALNSMVRASALLCFEKGADTAEYVVNQSTAEFPPDLNIGLIGVMSGLAAICSAAGSQFSLELPHERFSKVADWCGLLAIRNYVLHARVLPDAVACGVTLPTERLQAHFNSLSVASDLNSTRSIGAAVEVAAHLIAAGVELDIAHLQGLAKSTLMKGESMDINNLKLLFSQGVVTVEMAREILREGGNQRCALFGLAAAASPDFAIEFLSSGSDALSLFEVEPILRALTAEVAIPEGIHSEPLINSLRRVFQSEIDYAQ